MSDKKLYSGNEIFIRCIGGETFSMHWVRESIVAVDNSMEGRDLEAMLEKAEAGDKVLLDNSDI